jgi:hypothetical protein
MIAKTTSQALATMGVMPVVHVSEIAAAMLEQAQKGLEKETLENADLVRLGRRTLGESGYVK